MTPTFLEATLAAAGLLILCAIGWRRWQTRWVRKLRLSGARGTVYVMQDREQPHLVKVGVTTRSSRERQAEIIRTMAAGAPLRQLLALDLAHARSVETVAHRRLRRRRHHSERGREWYHAATARQLGRLLAEVELAARDVKRLARRQGAWNQDDEETACRWQLTRNGPIREHLFQPGAAR